MNKDKQDFYTEIAILTFFISVVIISISLDFGAYVANFRAVELVNQDISYLKDMQIALPSIPSIEKIILTQECNLNLISLVQSTFLFYGIATFALAIIALYVFRKRFSKFDNRITEFRLILKQGKKVYLPLFSAFFAISLMFFALGLSLELSKDEALPQMLGDIVDAQTGQEDRILLLEALLFDTSQNHFENLFYGFYFLGIGLSSVFAYLIHIFKKGPNLLSSVILYGTIIAIIYFPILLMDSPVQGYSSIITSEEFELFCIDLVNPDQQNKIGIENSNSTLNYTSNDNSTQNVLKNSLED